MYYTPNNNKEKSVKTNSTMKTLESSKTQNPEATTIKVSNSNRRINNDRISHEQRVQLIDLIARTKSFRKSSEMLGIHESTAKSIYYKYERTGRIERAKRTSNHVK